MGETLEGETMLLPKQLIEQANVINLIDDQEEEEIDKNHLDLSDENKPEDKQTSVTDILKTSYISQGNVVRCVTGSFD